MYFYHRYQLFLDSLNDNFIALLYAMVELNINHWSNGKGREVPKTKKKNPLEGAFLFLILSHTYSFFRFVL